MRFQLKEESEDEYFTQRKRLPDHRTSELVPKLPDPAVIIKINQAESLPKARKFIRPELTSAVVGESG